LKKSSGVEGLGSFWGTKPELAAPGCFPLKRKRRRAGKYGKKKEKLYREGWGSIT